MSEIVLQIGQIVNKPDEDIMENEVVELKSLLGRLISSFAEDYENKFTGLLLLKDVVGDIDGNSNGISWVEKQFRRFFECGVYFLNDLFGIGFGRKEEGNMVALNLFPE